MMNGIRNTFGSLTRSIRQTFGLETATAEDVILSNSESGVPVTTDAAIRLAAVWACVRVISEDIASLPIHIYRRNASGSRQKVIDTSHSTYRVLHSEPNADLGLTAMQFYEVMQAWACIYGNAYAYIERDAAFRVKALWPVHPSSVSVSREGKKKVFSVMNADGVRVPYSTFEMIHLFASSMSGDGLTGMSPISAAKEAIGMALAAEKFGARFFKNGTRPSGVIENANTMKKDQVEEFARQWNAAYSGSENVGKVPILHGGLTWKTMSIPPQDAQFVESRKFQIGEIARIFRVPPHKIGDLERATFSNVEQLSIDYVVGTIRPWLVRWEQELNRVLFSADDKGQWFAEFVVDGLMRGDAVARHNVYRSAITCAMMSPNEARDLENMNPYEGGDRYFIQGAMVPLDKANQSLDAPPVTPVDGDNTTI
ncbi:MAG: phage portal protein [Bryobacteraceae bacterium]